MTWNSDLEAALEIAEGMTSGTEDDNDPHTWWNAMDDIKSLLTTAKEQPEAEAPVRPERGDEEDKIGPIMQGYEKVLLSIMKEHRSHLPEDYRDTFCICKSECDSCGKKKVVWHELGEEKYFCLDCHSFQPTFDVIMWGSLYENYHSIEYYFKKMLEDIRKARLPAPAESTTEDIPSSASTPAENDKGPDGKLDGGGEEEKTCGNCDYYNGGLCDVVDFDIPIGYGVRPDAPASEICGSGDDGFWTPKQDAHGDGGGGL